jgi:hypothetical protein
MQIKPPGVERTLYWVTFAPPLEIGAVQEMTELALAFELAETAVGDPGTVEGVAVVLPAVPAPLAFVAVTLKL